MGNKAYNLAFGKPTITYILLKNIFKKNIYLADKALGGLRKVQHCLCKIASKSMLTLCESRCTLNNHCVQV